MVRAGPGCPAARHSPTADGMLRIDVGRAPRPWQPGGAPRGCRRVRSIDVCATPERPYRPDRASGTSLPPTRWGEVLFLLWPPSRTGGAGGRRRRPFRRADLRFGRAPSRVGPLGPNLGSGFALPGVCHFPASFVGRLVFRFRHGLGIGEKIPRCVGRPAHHGGGTRPPRRQGFSRHVECHGRGNPCRGC